MGRSRPGRAIHPHRGIARLTRGAPLRSVAFPGCTPDIQARRGIGGRPWWAAPKPCRGPPGTPRGPWPRALRMHRASRAPPLWCQPSQHPARRTPTAGAGPSPPGALRSPATARSPPERGSTTAQAGAQKPQGFLWRGRVIEATHAHQGRLCAPLRPVRPCSTATRATAPPAARQRPSREPNALRTASNSSPSPFGSVLARAPTR